MVNPDMKKHIIHGLKTGAASLLSFGLTEYLNIPNGFWAVITTVIVMQVYVADSVSMSIYRFTGTAIGACIGILAIAVFPETKTWTSVSLFMAISFCSFMTRYNARYKMAAITVVIVILASMGEIDRVSFAGFRVIEIAVGIFSASIVSILVVPARRVDVLRQNLKEQALEFSDKYVEITESFVSGQKTVPDNMLDELTDKIFQNQSIYQMILRHEAFIYRKDVYRSTDSLVIIMRRSLEHLRTMIRSLNSVDSEGFTIIMAEELRELSKITGETLIDFSDNLTSKPEKLKKAMEVADKRLKSLRAEGVTMRFSVDKLTQVFSFYHTMHCLAEDIINCSHKS